MRAATLLLCIALAACRTTAENSTPSTDPAAPAATSPTAAQPAAPDTAPSAPRRGAAQALRGTSPPPTPPPERDPQYSPEQRNLMIRQICWSSVDKNRALRTEDARVGWVNKCIADKSKEPLAQPASQ